MSSRSLLLAAVLGLSALHGAHAQSGYTEDMPKSLQTDALTVITYNMVHDLAVQVCGRLDGAPKEDVAREVARWKQRNDGYIKSAGQALDTFAARQAATAGAKAGVQYTEDALGAVVAQSVTAVRNQFQRAAPDNALLPAPGACTAHAGKLRAGDYDFRNMPQVTQSLTLYMNRKK
jgi:hypothetical protein